MFNYAKRLIFLIILCFFLIDSNLYADHTKKTKLVKELIEAVVEVHADRKIKKTDGFVKKQRPKKRGGFKYRNEPRPEMQDGYDPKKEPTHLGSGFVISDDGYVITNAHVVNNIFEGGKISIIFHDDTSEEAELINYDEDSDIALLKIIDAKKNFKFLTWGNKPELGEDVIAVGSPMNQSFTVTFGNVSSVDRFVPNAASFVPFIQTDAAMNPGNSGGPLFNMEGRLVGINTMIITDNNSRGSIGIGFAIDGIYAQAVIEKLKTGRKIIWPYLGIMYRPVEKKEMKEFKYGYGAYIQEIVKKSPAVDLLRVGDIILKIDGKPVKWKMLATLVKSKKIGDTLNLEILRNGFHIPITMILKGTK